MAVNQRMQAATSRVEESCKRVKDISNEILRELEDVTPIPGIPMMDLDDEDSAVIAIHEVLEQRTEIIEPIAAAPKRRARTEPGVR